MESVLLIGTQVNNVHWFCCATFVSCVYEHVAGIQIRDHEAAGVRRVMQRIGQRVDFSDLQPGDVLWKSHHVGIYIGNNQTAEASGSEPYPLGSMIIGSPAPFTEAYRISEATASTVTALNSTCSITGTGMSASSANNSNIEFGDFFFNGIPDGKYSKSSVKIFDVIIDVFSNISKYIAEIIAFIIRVTIIGLVSVGERLLNSTFRSLTGTNTSLEDVGLDATNADDPTSENRYVTVDSILFNKLKVLDINIFKAL